MCPVGDLIYQAQEPLALDEQGPAQGRLHWIKKPKVWVKSVIPTTIPTPKTYQ